MNKPLEPAFTSRPTVTIELPFDKHTRILHPGQVILKIADTYQDIGALCYGVRSDKARKARQPREVVISSFINQRPKQILQFIKALSRLVSDGGKALTTTAKVAHHFIAFMDWADASDQHECLAGGATTRNAFHGWVTETRERYKRQELAARAHNAHLSHVCELLETALNLENLMQGIRKAKNRFDPNGGTESLALHDFAHAVALNQAIFDGLCDLVLEQRPFPYKLDLPASLGWTESHLWLFPTNNWFLAPHQWDETIRAKMRSQSGWPYDYENGCLSTLDDIWHRYKGRTPAEQRDQAKRGLRSAEKQIMEANRNAWHTWRFTLGMHAQAAFLFLFFCNTGSNQQVILDIETEDSLDISVQNQKFRAVKWRAGGKEVTLAAPATFMPRLRRFMELRQYLLQGRKTTYLFFRCGNRNNVPPTRGRPHDFDRHYRRLLIEIDPKLPKMGPRTLRASVDDYYLRLHDSVVAAAVMGHTVETEEKKYARGSATDQHEDMTLFLTSVSESARHQRIIPLKDATPNTPPLEEGGHCEAYGHPEALADYLPLQPDCKNSQGCLFCSHRVLIAGEEDARKVASAAYVMEQLILGPKHEEALRPSIAKCDEDLEKLAAFPGCRNLVENVRNDVYENENLTSFWADKYQLFLELGVI